MRPSSRKVSVAPARLSSRHSRAKNNAEYKRKIRFWSEFGFYLSKLRASYTGYSVQNRTLRDPVSCRPQEAAHRNQKRRSKHKQSRKQCEYELRICEGPTDLSPPTGRVTSGHPWSPTARTFPGRQRRALPRRGCKVCALWVVALAPPTRSTARENRS